MDRIPFRSPLEPERNVRSADVLSGISNHGHNMDKGEKDKLTLNSMDKITSIFSDFMLRIAKFDELVATTYQFLVGFQQEFVNSCMQGLQDHLIRAKPLLDELESFKEDAIVVAKSENLSYTPFFDSPTIDNEKPTLDEDNKPDYMHLQGKLTSYATLMTVIYSMFKLDYSMQEAIIISINLTGMGSEQLGNYCFMWNLRPYINENIMSQSWKLIDR